MIKKPTRKIENKGVNCIEDYFWDCDLIDTYINTDDREPLWDGNLYLHSSVEQKSTQIYGKIPTQVKSSCKKTAKSTISYSVQKKALESYKRDGGIVYFYVLFNNPIDKQIFYCFLTPVVIKKYLRAPSNGNTISITLNRLSSDKHQVTEDFFQFFSDCKNQTTSADKPIVEIEDYFSKTGKRQFSVFAKSTEPIKDIFKHMQDHPQYLYATDEDKNITFAIGDGPVTVKIGRNVQQEISVNGIPYFKGCTVFEEDDGGVLTIGNFFTYRFGNQTKKDTFTFNFEGHSNLQKIPFISFCLAIIKYGKFNVGSFEIPCKSNDDRSKQIKELESELRVLCNIRSLFSAMHIEGDINIDELSADALSNLDALYKGIVLKKPLELKPGVENMSRISIGPLVLYVVFEPNENGKHYVRDFFMYDEICGVLKQDNTAIKTSRFSLLSAEQFAEASNFDFSTMMASYEEFVKQNEKVAEYANCDMLRMILAYDITEGKKTKLLDAAETLVDWFIKTKRLGDLPINEINKYQILKRRGLLSKEENNRICEILESDVPDDYKVACMLLLDNQSGAEYYFNKLSEEKKEELKDLPIYKFWK